MHLAAVLVEDGQVDERVDVRLGTLGQLDVEVHGLMLLADEVEEERETEHVVRIGLVAIDGGAVLGDGGGSVAGLLELLALLEVVRCALGVACDVAAADDRVETRSGHFARSSC